MTMILLGCTRTVQPQENDLGYRPDAEFEPKHIIGPESRGGPSFRTQRDNSQAR